MIRRSDFGRLQNQNREDAVSCQKRSKTDGCGVGGGGGGGGGEDGDGGNNNSITTVGLVFIVLGAVVCVVVLLYIFWPSLMTICNPAPTPMVSSVPMMETERVAPTGGLPSIPL